MEVRKSNIFLLPGTNEKTVHLFHFTKGKIPILLIHGFHSSEKIWISEGYRKDTISFAQKFAEHDFSVWLLRFSDPTHGNIHDLTMIDLLSALKMIEKLEQRVHTLVGHSMGGIAIRYLIKKHGLSGPLGQLKNVVFLAVPHHGVSLAQVFPNIGTSTELLFEYFSRFLSKTGYERILNRAYFQLLSNSEIIRFINTPKIELDPTITWFNAIADKDIIVPENSAQLPRHEIAAAEKVRLLEKKFHATHMKNAFQFLYAAIEPLFEKFPRIERERILENLKKIQSKAEYLTAPPIYHVNDCAEWILRKITY